MTAGRLIAVVGPSGVGKDSVMQALADAVPGLVLVRRTITRPSTAGGERHEEATEDAFLRLAAQGAFALSWQAHGHRYGIRRSALGPLEDGRDCLVNLSRAVLAEAAALTPRLVVLSLTAAPETLAARLAARGRERPDAIRDRLARRGGDWPEGVAVVSIANDGDLAATVAKARRALGLSCGCHETASISAPAPATGQRAGQPE